MYRRELEMRWDGRGFEVGRDEQSGAGEEGTGSAGHALGVGAPARPFC